MKLYDAGYTRVTAFDYSADAVDRAATLFADRPISLHCADATALPFGNDSFDAVLDKGTLDAIGIHSLDALRTSVSELARVIAPSGVVVSISRALEPEVLAAAFDPNEWETLRDGSLHVAEGGEVSTDLAAGLLAWRRQESGAGAL